MKIKNYIIRISGTVLVLIILVLTILAIAYKESKKYEYTYVIGNDFGKSKKCYIDTNDFRVCELQQKIIKVDYFYEDVEYE